MTPTDEGRERHFVVHVVIGTGRIMILYFLLFVGVMAWAHAQGRVDVDSFSAPGSIVVFFVKALPTILLFSFSIGWGRAMRMSDTGADFTTGTVGALICSVVCSPLLILTEYEDVSSVGAMIFIYLIFIFLVSWLIIFGVWFRMRKGNQSH